MPFFHVNAEAAKPVSFERVHNLLHIAWWEGFILAMLLACFKTMFLNLWFSWLMILVTSRHCISEKQDSLATVRLWEQRMNRNILELESKFIKTYQNNQNNSERDHQWSAEVSCVLGDCRTSEVPNKPRFRKIQGVMNASYRHTIFVWFHRDFVLLCEYIGGCMLYYATMIHNVRDGHEKCKGTLWMLICCL